MKGPTQDEVIRIFYANIFDINHAQRSFKSIVNEVLISVNLYSVSNLLGVPHVTNEPIPFPIHKLFIEQKGESVQRLCGQFLSRSENLKHGDCRPVGKFLHCIFTYNILPTTHKSDLTDDAVDLIDAILDLQRNDSASIICYMMIKAHESKHPTSILPYPTLVTSIMPSVKVPFKVAAKGRNSGPAFGHGTLQRMGLIKKDEGRSSFGATLHPGLD